MASRFATVLARRPSASAAPASMGMRRYISVGAKMPSVKVKEVSVMHRRCASISNGA